MLEGLSDKLRGALKDLRGHGRITESNIDSALREVRLALLEADVNLKVVKSFITAVKDTAMGDKVLLSVTPGDQFTKIVKDELTKVLGGSSTDLELKGSPAVIMMVGLQGAGKTTTTAKLAKFLKSKGRTPFVVPCDLQRAAAVTQLEKLSSDIGVDCFTVGDLKGTATPVTPMSVCTQALKEAKVKNYDTMIVDTAGRLHIDKALMDELKAVKNILKPIETLFVADAMTGQDAVNTASGFNEALGLTGAVLTKLDSDARGGAALSMAVAAGVSIKFAGLGEKIDALEVFHPERLAGRILGMGDITSLVEKASEVIDEKKAKELERKIKKDAFDLQDFRDQLKQIKKMGSLDSIMSMVPGFDAMKKSKGIKVDDKDLVQVEAIIDSMTPKERRRPGILNAKRRIRIAKGSGTKVSDVNKVIKQHGDMKKMMKMMKKRGGMNPLSMLK